MAGSRKTVVYTADDGNPYLVNLDESNTELDGFGFLDYDDALAAAGTAKPLPSGWQMRHINVVFVGLSPTNFSRRKLYIGSSSVVAAVLSLASVLLPWYVGGGGYNGYVPTGYKAEERRAMSALDTGLTDGDDT